LKLKLTILYIHPVGVFGGASRSLLELLRAFSGSSIEMRVICPKGQVAAILEKENTSVVTASGLSQFDNTYFSHYRGLRWLITIRELAFALPTLIALRTAKHEWGDVDIVHVNELSAIPVALMARFFFKAPLVMHVRSVQRPMADGLRGKLLKYLVRHYVDQLVAIDCTVRESLPKDLSVEIVRNGFPSPNPPRAKPARATNRLFSKDNPLRVGCVGGLLKLKGVYEFVEAAHKCNQSGLSVEFILVGENPRKLRGLKGYFLKRFGFATDALSELNALIGKYNLHDTVKILGFTHDVKSVYDSIDLLCFPSHLNACGRPVFEAAFSGVPSIVAIDNPQEDTILNGHTGICIPAKSPIAIAEAIMFFYSHPGELERMGEAAFQLAKKNFDIDSNAKKMIDIYNRLLRERTSQEMNT
jgi:glycosyltransferase involved in cell wall biosynthesis